MPISIQFDSLDELKKFLAGKSTSNFSIKTGRAATKAKPGPKPKAAVAEPVVRRARTAKKVAAVKQTSAKAKPGRPGRKPKLEPVSKAKAIARPGRKPAAVSVKKASVSNTATSRKGREAADKKVVRIGRGAAQKMDKGGSKTSSRSTSLRTAKERGAALKAQEKARSKGRPRSSGSLTAKIQDTIQKFISNRIPFTANDIYEDLVKRDKTVNKQSVITSVLKQMKTSFDFISVEERPGAGPRPVKVYLP